jgi:hypothetical protein
MVVMSQIAGPAPLQPGPASSSIAARRAWYRRRALIIAVVLVVIAAAGTALFLVLNLVTITASGIVLDRLTGQPVALARVHADGSATLYLTGPGQALTVTAGGYRPARTGIGPDHTATIALDPAHCRGHESSAAR